MTVPETIRKGGSLFGAPTGYDFSVQELSELSRHGLMPDGYLNAYRAHLLRLSEALLREFEAEVSANPEAASWCF
jgi:hypothetical protein